MGLFGKSDDSTPSESLWNRLTKNHRKQEQKSNCNNAIPNQVVTRLQNKHQSKPPLTRITEESKKENFRLSLQSLRTRSVNSPSLSQQQYRASCSGTDQLDSRLRTSKLQCEQLKKKVATISLECNKLENQCRELKEVKEHILSFQSDITMLKRKEKVTSEIQQRLNFLDEENSIMKDQIEKLRIKISDLDSEIDPDLINKRLEQLEIDSHQLTSITLQNRRDHDNFSLDVGNQLVETFITQQTIYEEFRRLQHRLVSVERQNQIMADLIHFHCHNSTRNVISRPMTNSDSSRGPLSMQASMEAASSSLSPPSSDREAEKINTSPSNLDWQLTDQSDSLFLCDTLNKSSEPSGELLNFVKGKDYYKIDFTTNSESLTTLPLTDLSIGSIVSTEEQSEIINLQSHLRNDSCEIKSNSPKKWDALSLDSKNQCSCFKFKSMLKGQQTNCQKDDGYYSTSHDGTMNINSTMLTICDSAQKTATVFLDNKKRYLILTKHLQKSHGRSKRIFAMYSTSLTIIVRSSCDLETQIYNRKLRQKQHKQRESHLVDEEETQVFSDTELYGTRFCIDSDLEDDELPSLFASSKTIPIKRSYNHGHSSKSNKNEPRHISSLPPLMEHVSERERKIEIKSSKPSRIIPPRIRPKSSNTCASSSQRLCETAKKIKDKQINLQKSETNTKISGQITTNSINNSKDINIRKPPKSVSSPKSSKVKTIEPKSPTSIKVRQITPNIDLTKPPPIPPRPKKKIEGLTNCIYERDLASVDYVNDAQIRVSPDGCQDVRQNYTNLHRKITELEANRKLRSNFSSPIDEYFIEEDVDERITHHINEFDDYFDQDFISELESYELPKSSVNMLVLQHFK